MDFSNAGSSFYHRVASVYSRTNEGQLLHTSGNFPSSDDSPVAEGLMLKTIEVNHGFHITGVTILAPTKLTKANTFVDQFSNLITSNARLDASAVPLSIDETTSQAQASAITDIFDRTIRNVGPSDQWHLGGRNVFEEKVQFFTSRACKVEFCLPAFPCKSSNLNKVNGIDPDKGEELALRRLHEFVSAVEAEYSPGAKVWIISDGHVFSDCIGVDDKAVDLYGQQLITMNHHIASDYAPDQVDFLSLVDLFFPPDTGYDFSTTVMRDAEALNVLHPISTVLDSHAETCRQILLVGCGADEADLRRKIDGKDISILKLYRGFSRFMLEDLATHPSTKSLSRSQCRKLSSKIAFEMIRRNQAYSNLIELLFPLHIRLSIHSHNNSGPKFGANLLNPKLCRMIASTSEYDGTIQDSPDLLHIPTPWHNCVFVVKDDSHYYVTKAQILRDAISTGLWIGEWVPGSLGQGGHFSVQKKSF